MADNTAEVKITGDTSGAVDAIDKAAGSAKTGTEGIIASFAKMTGETASSMSEFASVVKEKAVEAQESLESLNKGIESVSNTLALIGSVLAGGEIGEKFLEIGKRAAEFGEQVSIASEKTGISAEDIQGLGFAATQSGSSMDQMVSAMDKLSVKLSETGDKSSTTSRALAALGVSMADVKGKSPDQVLDLIANRFHDTADGANKTAIAMALFGRAGADMIPLLNQGAQAIEGQKQKAQELGITLDASTIKSLKEMNEQFKEQKAVGDSLWNMVGAQMAPTFITLSKAFEESMQKGGQLRKILDALPSILRFVANGASYVAQGFQEAGTYIGGMVAAAAAIPGGLKPVGEVLTQLDKDLKTQEKDWEAFRAAIEHPITPPHGFVGPPDGRNKPQPGAIGGDPKQEKDPSQMAAIEEFLDEEKLKYEQTHALRQMDLQDIEAYWERVKENYVLNEHDATAVEKKIVDAKMAINKEALAQQTALETESIDASEKLGLAQISMAEQHAKSLYDQKKISADQMLAIDLQYEQQRLNVEETALGQRLAMLANDPTASPAALQKIKDQMLQVNQQYLAKVQQLNDAAAKQDDKIWENSAKTMVQSLGSAFEGIITGSETAAQAMENIFKSLLNIVVGIGEQMAEKWVMDNLINKTSTASTAAAQVGSNAAVAGSAAFASIAAIPFVGPELAPAAAAAAYAGAMSFAPLASAAGGFDIPAGINPLVQTHAREMILPADLADTVRNAMGGGGGGGGGNVHITVQALDSKSLERALSSNTSALSKALMKASRQFQGANA